jgi:hypothetical protein
MIERYYQDFASGFKKKVCDLEIWAAGFFLEQAFSSIIFEMENIENTDSKVGMDSELISKFGSKVFGLETVFDTIPVYKTMFNSLESLIELYKTVKQSLENERITEGDGDLQALLSDYRQGELLYQKKFAFEADWDDPHNRIRHPIWIENFLKYHACLEISTLFGVGANHLLGETGLLCSLPKAGFKLKKLTPHGTFEDYQYPFRTYSTPRISLFQEYSSCNWMRKLYEEQCKARNKESDKMALVVYSPPPAYIAKN